MILALYLVVTCCSACDSIFAESAESTVEPTIVLIEPTESLPAALPPATELPTDPPEPTIPPLGIETGLYFDSYHSDVYGDYLDYYVHVPENAVIDMPLVVYLHGDGEVNQPESLPARGLSKLTKKVYGEEFPFILLEPNTRIKSWISNNIPAILMELIEFTADQYNIDKDKIIITGHSRGAIGVWKMISVYGGYFSAAVPVSSPHKAGHMDYIKSAEVPVWTFAGDIGDIERWYHEYLSKNVEMIQVSGGYGKFTILEGCDHGKAKNKAYVKETFEWMLAQQRGIIPEE